MAVDRVDPKSGAVSQSVKAASQAEKDAQDRILLARKRVEQAQAESESKIVEVKDEFVRRSDTESQRNETALLTQRDKGYERIREMQRQNAAEEARILREGESKRSQLTEFYRDTVQTTEKTAKEKLLEIQLRTQTTQELADRTLADQTSSTEMQHRARMDELKSARELQFEAANRVAIDEYQRVSQNHEQARVDARAKFESDYAALVKKNEEILSGIDKRASRSINEIRQDTSAKLAAYGSRQEDPFYKMMNVESRMDETKEAYILTARVPVHEREGLTVNVRGDQLVLGVKRRNEESLQGDRAGKLSTTSSYQSFSESFPLGSPVDSRMLTREFDGDLLLVTIPKKNATARPPRHEPPERVRAERPVFPGNLPIADSKPSGKSGGTLT